MATIPNIFVLLSMLLVGIGEGVCRYIVLEYVNVEYDMTCLVQVVNVINEKSQ